MNVLWIHNFKDDRTRGSFMWDILDRIRSRDGFEIFLKSVPVVRKRSELIAALRSLRSGPVPEIVHGQYGSLVGALTGFHGGSVRILSLRGSDIYWRYGSFLDRLGGLFRMALSWVGCLRSDAIVVMSNSMRDRVRQWPLMRNRPIYVLVDPAGDIFWPSSIRQLADAIRSHPFTVLIASLVDANPVKRLTLVNEAVELCKRASLAITLKVLTGVPRTEVCEAIRSSNSVALASTHEGWPNIIKEALLLGRPFVATDVADLKVFASPDSANCIVAPSPLEFAFAWVEQIAGQLLDQCGLDRRLAPFHPDVCSIKHELLYYYVIGARG